MKKLFNKEQEDFILANYLNMTYKDLAEKLPNFSADQIRGWLNHNGYNKKGHRSIFSDKDKAYMRNNYLSMTYKDIAKEIGFTERQIRGWINNNCENKLRQFNKSYFKDIIKPNQAYWLGFIYADGWVINNPKKRNYELGIELCSIDEQHLIDFNNELGGVHIIKHMHSEQFILNNPAMSITDSVCIRIYSKDIVNDLISHNVLENKSNRSEYPIVDDALFLDFLRGYFDGDGCLYVNETKYYRSQLHITSAHEEVLIYIKDRLMELYNIKSEIYQETERKYRIYISNTDLVKFLDLLYYDSSLQKLDRKYQKYLLYKALLFRNK